MEQVIVITISVLVILAIVISVIKAVLKERKVILDEYRKNDQMRENAKIDLRTSFPESYIDSINYGSQKEILIFQVPESERHQIIFYHKVIDARFHLVSFGKMVFVHT